MLKPVRWSHSNYQLGCNSQIVEYQEGEHGPQVVAKFETKTIPLVLLRQDIERSVFHEAHTLWYLGIALEIVCDPEKLWDNLRREQMMVDRDDSGFWFEAEPVTPRTWELDSYEEQGSAANCHYLVMGQEFIDRKGQIINIEQIKREYRQLVIDTSEPHFPLWGLRFLTKEGNTDGSIKALAMLVTRVYAKRNETMWIPFISDEDVIRLEYAFRRVHGGLTSCTICANVT